MLFVIPFVHVGEQVAEINRELLNLKRMFSLAVQAEKLLRRPHIPLLEERNTRTGFFELEMPRDVLPHLPAALQPVIRFAYITGWRIPSEGLPLEWRQVDLMPARSAWIRKQRRTATAGCFPHDRRSPRPLTAQHAEYVTLKKAGQIVLWVLYRLVGKGRRGPKQAKPILAFTKGLKSRLSGRRVSAPHPA